MTKTHIQTSFNSGEWAPSLYARVDIAKYHSGAALLRNWFVDYRGGATTRPGSKYIIQSKSTSTIRLIPFQASQSVSYILEFGAILAGGTSGYLSFINNGAPVLNTGIAITGATRANPCVVSVANAYTTNDRVFISGVVGMTQLNGNYYTILARTAGTITLGDLNGVPIDSTAYGGWTSGGTTRSIYTIASPYTSSELAGLKFTQNVNKMIFCHPNHPPYELILTSATNWTLSAIAFGATIGPPGGLSGSSTLAAGAVNYAYIITSVDINGQESAPSAFFTLSNLQDIRTSPGTNAFSFAAVTGAASYNVYRANPRYGNAVPAGATFGFVGNITGLLFYDSNIQPDFSQGPPVPQNPFSGSGVQSVTITAQGNVTNLAVPTPIFSGGGGTGATGIATARLANVALNAGGFGYTAGDQLNLPGGGQAIVNSISGGGVITSIIFSIAGVLFSGASATQTASPIAPTTNHTGFGATLFTSWVITDVAVTSPGAGYGSPPAVALTGGATAVATLGASGAGNPTVPQLHQQRLVLAGPVASPQQFNISKPGAYYNFDFSTPLEPDDAFQGTLVSGQLNTIQSMISQPQGLIVLSDKQAWLLNGGSAGSAISATDTVANSQAYNGASFPPPIVANDNILYVQAKNSIVRDLQFNFYTQVYTGADISVLSSHLFYGFNILEWAWAEEPFKLVWAVRNDGALLSLTFLKEQELIAWAHSDTNGLFKSIASVTEQVTIGLVDAVYVVVQRTINGNTVQYIERLAELYYPSGSTDSWQVDAGLQYNGVSALSFTGAQHLALASCVGVATNNTGNVTTFTATVDASGAFTLAAPTAPATGYTRVTIGLAFTPQLETLPIDLGEPTIQGEMKKISEVTLRVNQTLGLQIGSTFDAANLVDVSDLVIGNIGRDTNTAVTNLVTGDAVEAIDPAWTVPGQYCIQQSLPYPASILGVIPVITTTTPKDHE